MNIGEMNYRKGLHICKGQLQGSSGIFSINRFSLFRLSDSSVLPKNYGQSEGACHGVI
jgi:hypothetical protein